LASTPIPAVKHPPPLDGEGDGEEEREWRAGGNQQST
jgi:hypothetical protein